MTALGPGVRVKCVDGSKWVLTGDTGPDAGSVWTIDRLVPKGTQYRGFSLSLLVRDYIFLKEWPSRIAYAVECFVPLDGNEDLSVLIGLLNKGPVDAPARKPEPVV